MILYESVMKIMGKMGKMARMIAPIIPIIPILPILTTSTLREKDGENITSESRHPARLVLCARPRGGLGAVSHKHSSVN